MRFRGKEHAFRFQIAARLKETLAAMEAVPCTSLEQLPRQAAAAAVDSIMGRPDNICLQQAVRAMAVHR